MKSVLLFIACTLATPFAAHADYPERLTRIVSPFSPGGGLDIVARLIAPKLSEAYRQPVIVENRTGANGLIAIEHVSKSPPDGYTLLIETLGVSIHPAVVKNLPYDPVKGLEPVAQLLSLPFVAVVNPKLEARNVRELIELAKRNPGKLNYAQGGMSNRILGELPRLETNTEFTFVPYKGSNPAIQAVLSGESDLIITDSITVAPHIASGRLRALAVTSPTRGRPPELGAEPDRGDAGRDSALRRARRRAGERDARGVRGALPRPAREMEGRRDAGKAAGGIA